MFSKKAVLFFITISLCSVAAYGADRALIVGVGDYALDSVKDLPGIDLDVDMMVSMAQLMGFERDNIMVLEDEKATFENVVTAMVAWLPKDLGPDDRVLFYFGGHGTLINDVSGDETGDRKDEALVLHDAGIKKEFHGITTVGVLVDELLGQLLDGIPSNNILVFVDACHSGTATRSLTEDPSYFGDSAIYPKFARLRDDVVDAGGVGQMLDAASKAATDGYVVMSAAQDDESAIATSRGSLFTISVSRSIRKAIQENRPITPERLINEARAFVRANVSPANIYSPQLSGNETKFGTPIPTVSLDNGAADAPGTQWVKLSEMADELSGKYGALQIRTNATDYRIGQDVEISVDVPATGYLNVVTVDSKDNSVVLFPNRYHEDNRVQAGQLRIPTSQMDFTLPVSEPVGQTLVVAFLSDRPISFYESQVGGDRDSNGKYVGDFAEVSPVATRAISVAPKTRPSSWVRANKLVVSTRR